MDVRFCTRVSVLLVVSVQGGPVHGWGMGEFCTLAQVHVGVCECARGCLHVGVEICTRVAVLIVSFQGGHLHVGVGFCTLACVRECA